jgi:4,5-dihydroxyphthalate decarboxylase
MSTAAAVKLRAMIGDYPITAAMKKGEVSSPHVSFDFADVKQPHTAFKRVVRDLEFDVAELAIVTFLMAKAHGKPLVLLPTVLMGRFQHPFLVYNAESGIREPRDLEGRRVGIRSYSVTTVTWLRGILAADCGVDLDRIRWVTFEDAHVAEFRDPPNAERAPAGKDLTKMLLDREVDAAIIGGPPPDDPRVQTLFRDPAAAARTWQQRYGAIQINHMVVVKDSLSRSQPQAVRELYRLLAESKRAAGLPAANALDTNPFGMSANRRNLEVAIDYVFRQRLIPRRYAVDELFDDVTRTLGA